MTIEKFDCTINASTIYDNNVNSVINVIILIMLTLHNAIYATSVTIILKLLQLPIRDMQLIYRI